MKLLADIRVSELRATHPVTVEVIDEVSGCSVYEARFTDIAEVYALCGSGTPTGSPWDGFRTARGLMVDAVLVALHRHKRRA